MNTYYVGGLALVVRELGIAENGATLLHLARHQGPEDVPDLQAQLAKSMRLSDALFKQFPLGACASSVEIAQHQLSLPAQSHGSIRTVLNRLQIDILAALKDRKFLKISDGMEAFIDNDKLFGKPVFDAFPSAQMDIREAGNCLAADCNTAAVFHLMRVAEHGLRVLAKRLKVKLTHNGAPCPIEFADWNKVLTQIKNKLLSQQKAHPGPVKQRRLEIYSDLADQCAYFKDLWRNNVSHTRRGYSSPEAVGILQRVQSFMVRLAESRRS